MVTPPPIHYRQPMSYGTKILLLGLQCGVLMIGALIIWSISYSREGRNKYVAEQIAQEWGESVYIQGPKVTEHLDSSQSVRPETFACDAKVETKTLHRNIYEAEVFDAHVTMTGTFNKDSLTFASDTVYLELGVVTKQITGMPRLTIGGTTVDWHKSNYFLFSRVDIHDMPQTIDFSTEFDIRGSSALFIKQIGYKSEITIDGEAPNPSFRGSSLPKDRLVRGRSFTARWESDDAPAGEIYNDGFGFVGTNFLVGVDRYQKVARSLKYAIMIILLTYISVLFTEIILKRNIPLLNYFLIGAALVIFYILLLSISEFLSFGIAYLIAAAMTVVLIAGYMWKMLGSRKIGGMIGLILTVIYLCCYILLSLTNYALLLGCLVLFVALAAMMYASLHINR